MVALLLAGIGFGIVWTTDSDSAEPGDIEAKRIKDLCELVDVKDFEKYSVTEDDRKSKADKKANPAKFTCELRLTSQKEAAAYQAITLNLDARVSPTIGDAQKAFSGAVEFEKSRGYRVDTEAKAADEAAVVAEANTDPQECRAHIRSSNAVLSAVLTVSGSQLSCPKEGVDLLLETGASMLDVMRSE